MTTPKDRHPLCATDGCELLIPGRFPSRTSVPSETPRIKELHARLWDHIGNTFPSIDDPTRAVLHGYLDELADAAQSKIAAIGKICPTCEGHANPERTVSAIGQRDFEDERRRNQTLVLALTKIMKGEGPFSRDPLTHATSTIESMKKLATDALYATGNL